MIVATVLRAVVNQSPPCPEGNFALGVLFASVSHALMQYSFTHPSTVHDCLTFSKFVAICYTLVAEIGFCVWPKNR